MAIWMYLILFVYGLACLILIAVILLQSGKGGGLSSLGASNQGLAEALGSTGAERTLTTWTTRAAVTFFVLALVISILSTKAFYHSRIGSNQPAPPAAAGNTFPAPAGNAVPGPVTGGPAGQTAPQNLPSAPSPPKP